MVHLLEVIGYSTNIISSDENAMLWRYDNGKGFSVESVYSALEMMVLSFPEKQLWNPKISLKVCFFVCGNYVTVELQLWKICTVLAWYKNCMLYGDHAETNSHIFLHYKTTFMVWSYFLWTFLKLDGSDRVISGELYENGGIRRIKTHVFGAICNLVECM